MTTIECGCDCHYVLTITGPLPRSQEDPCGKCRNAHDKKTTENIDKTRSILTEYDGPHQRIEEGHLIDCKKNGCNPICVDNGFFVPWRSNSKNWI